MIKRTLFLLIVLSAMARTSGAQTAATVLDNLNFASEASRSAHAVRLDSASAKVVHNAASLGTLIAPVAGVRLAPGGSVTARLKAATDGRGTIMVTLATAPGDAGRRQAYRVTVSGTEIYRASEIDPGAGVARSIFLPAPPGDGTCEVTVATDAATPCPVTVATMRSYAAFDARPKALARMGIALVSPADQGYRVDAALMRETARRIPASPYLIPQVAVLYNFCVRGALENRAEIDRLAALAADTSVPLRIAFQVHWGGVPRGVPDGAGGTFMDLPYQQITYDQDDKVNEPGLAALMGDQFDVRYGLTAPNVWSDTPWLTFNHPRLNQFRRIRLTQALMAWRAARERLAQVGRERLLPIELSTGDETIYWAKGVDDRKYTALNGGQPRAHLEADFNPFVVADALRDRVYLDPRTGLDTRARWWLHQNLARQQQRLVDWMFDALPADPIRFGAAGGASGSSGAYASDLVRRNLFTEPYAMPMYPMQDLTPWHPGLELGYVHDGRSGGEYWSGATMLPWLLKERERGRIAVPNLECTGAGDEQIVACLRAAFACGARFTTLYNWVHKQDITADLRAFANSVDRFAGQDLGASDSPRHEWEFTAGPDAFGVNCVALHGLPPAISAVRVMLHPADPAAPNAPHGAYAADVEATVPVEATDRASGDTVAQLPTLYPLQPGARYRLTVVPIGPAATTGQRAAPALSCRICADIAFERARSEAIAAWQDASDLLGSLRLLHAHTAQSLFAREALDAAGVLLDAAKPAEAYRAGIRAEQLALPASFSVPAGVCRLAPYWLTVVCPAARVEATITTYTARVAVVSIRSAAPQKVKVRWGRVETSAELTANIPAEIALEQPAGGVATAQSAAPAQPTASASRAQVGRSRASAPVRRRRRRRRPRARTPILGPPAPALGPPAPKR